MRFMQSPRHASRPRARVRKEMLIEEEQKGRRGAPFPLALQHDSYAAGRFCLHLLNSSIIARLNAGMSSGLRAVTRFPSTTASLSTHSAPALRISVLSEGHEAIFRPRAAPASITDHGPWQIAATGLPVSKNALTKATALGSMRSLSGLITPPGRSSASKSSARALLSGRSTDISSPPSVNSQPLIRPSFGGH